VTLKIGPRPGELKFDVKDKSTGKPVQGYGVRWIALDDARLMSVEIPRPHMLIPPDIDVIVEVHAEDIDDGSTSILPTPHSQPCGSRRAKRSISRWSWRKRRRTDIPLQIPCGPLQLG